MFRLTDPAARLRFRATRVDRLQSSGGVATLSGGAVANGQPGYRFRATLREAAAAPGPSDPRSDRAGLPIGDHAAQIMSEGVNRFAAAIGQGELFRLLADARQRPARTIAIRWSAVVVAKLDQHPIARLQLRANFVPQAFRDKGSAAAAGTGPVDDRSLADRIIAKGWAQPRLFWLFAVESPTTQMVGVDGCACAAAQSVAATETATHNRMYDIVSIRAD